MIIASITANAQNFPPPGSCTSKDLELVGATLPGVAPCNYCTPGTTVTRVLNLSIWNKTGSTRTSFAYWGTLEIYNDDGTLDSAHSGPISGCVGPIPSNSITTVPNTTITYTCGQSLKLTNLYLAWTDASPNSTCAALTASPSTINPKCGTLPEILINAGVNAIANVTNATCSSNGAIQVNPLGGTPPYAVSLGATNYTGVTTSVTFSGLAPGTYTVNVTDVNGCTVSKTRTIGPPTDNPAPPVSGGNQTVCAVSPLQTLTATATGTGITWHDALVNGNLINNPTLNSVGTVTYYAQSNVGTCSSTRTPVTLTINPTPASPVSGGNLTECQQAPLQTLTAIASGNNITWYDAATNGNIIANPVLNSIGSVTYYAQANLGACSSPSRTPVSLTINPRPAAPVSGGNLTECQQAPLQTLTAIASGNNITWYDAATNGNLIANPVLNSIGSVTYYAQANLGACSSFSRTPVVLTINPTPSAAVSGGNITECEQSPLQTLTATASGSNITWYDAATNGNLIANPVLNSIGTVTYYAQANLGSCSSFNRIAVTLTINPRPAAPVSGGNIIECEQSPIQTLTATATGNSITWHTKATGGVLVANPILNSVGTITYYAQSQLGSCKSFTRTPVTLKINHTPPAPVSGGDQAECKQNPIQTLTATATGSSVTWYTAAVGGTLVTNPTLKVVGTKTYYAQSKLGNCKSLTRTPVTLTIYPNPADPVICVVEPSLCGPVFGSVTFISPIGAGYNYSIDNGNSYQTSPVFNNLSPGSVTGIMVNDQHGCISGSVSCEVSDCSSARLSSPDDEVNNGNNNEQKLITTDDQKTSNTIVNVYPNPFYEQVNFEVMAPKSGNGTLEIYNILNQKVTTVFDGYFHKGNNKFELNLNEQHQVKYIYKLSINDEIIVGKFFHFSE